MDRLYQSVQHFTSGAVGGAALVVAGQPFDTVKVKLQTFRHTFRGPLQCLLWTLKNEGILRGLYAGSVPSFFANMTENAVLFLFYEHCKSIVSMLCGGGNEVLQKAVAGAGAAGISTIFLCPFELLKCRLQAQQQLLNKASEMTGEPLRTKAGFRSMCLDIIATNGIRGLYRGLPLLLFREVPGYFFLFGGYEGSRWLLAPEGKSVDSLGSLPLFVAGGIAGISYWLPMYPVDIVKSKAQVEDMKYPFLRTTQAILSSEGIGGLYHGLVPCLVRAFIANAVLFMAYELTKSLISNTGSS